MEGLREKALDFARPSYHRAIGGVQLVKSQNRDNVLQLFIAL